jgi:hypothetical protein
MKQLMKKELQEMATWSVEVDLPAIVLALAGRAVGLLLLLLSVVP